MSKIKKKPPLTFERLRQTNLSRYAQLWAKCENWGLAEWACAVAGETGEACNFIKKRLRGQRIHQRSIARELADIVIYLDLLAEKAGIDLGEAVREKFNAVSDRHKCKIKL